MWTITNSTPYAAERGWVRDRDGAEVWLVAVKATFVIAPDGSTRLADRQEPVCVAPVYRGEPGQSSLLYDSDLYPPKMSTDIVVNGQAYAPEARAARRVDVTLKVGTIEKSLAVFGDRRWRSGVGLSLSEPEPFVTMPIVYERAFGGSDVDPRTGQPRGWDERNPVGLGFGVRAEHLADRRAPNVESPGSLIASAAARPHPAGFAVVASHWQPRIGYGGTYDDRWKRERQPLVPDDFDDRFYQCTPEDQQAKGFLTGGEVAELRNMTPAGVLSFRLPRQVIGFQTDFDDGSTAIHRGALHTVIIEPDTPRVMLVWHTHLPCHHKVLKLKTTRITVKRRLNSELRPS